MGGAAARPNRRQAGSHMLRGPIAGKPALTKSARTLWEPACRRLGAKRPTALSRFYGDGPVDKLGVHVASPITAGPLAI